MTINSQVSSSVELMDLPWGEGPGLMTIVSADLSFSENSMVNNKSDGAPPLPTPIATYTV